MPETDDYAGDDEDDDQSKFDEKAFTEAMEEYQEEMEQYNLLLQSGKLQKGLLIMENNLRVLAFNPEKQIRQTSGQTVTAKDVQSALKNGTATPALLQSEIDRINNKEIRNRQLDREKIQMTVHEQFSRETADPVNIHSITHADQIAARLLIYQSLDYQQRSKINAALFTVDAQEADNIHDRFYQQLAALTESQYSFLIRTAVLCKADSKFPNNSTGFVLYKLAESAGVNVELIEHGQQQKAATRQAKQEEKIKDLQNQISKL